MNVLAAMLRGFWEFLDTKNGMVMSLSLGILIILWTLERKSRSHASPFNWDDLLTGPDGKVSKSACLVFGSFGITTWSLIFLVINDRLTEWYLTVYMGAYVAPSIVEIFRPKPPPAA